MKKIKSQKRLYSRKNKRIGVLGGTFDPPHLAHIHMALSAKDALSLDYVVFMPLGVAPHGKNDITEASHRLKMLEIILSTHKDFYIDDYELYLNSPSYTVNSAERINDILDKTSKVIFIVGADSLLYLEKWYKAEKLLKIAEFAVIPRVGHSENDCKNHIKKLEIEFGATISYIEVPELDYSSTEIRRQIYSNDIQTTSDEVAKYIKDNKLYINK